MSDDRRGMRDRERERDTERENRERATEQREHDRAREDRSAGKIGDEAWNDATSSWLANNMRSPAMTTEAWNHVIEQLPGLRRLLESKL